VKNLHVKILVASLMLAILCANADAYVSLTVTGTNVNVRTEAKAGSKVLTQANPGDMFIADDEPVTGPDGMKWYKIIMTVGNGYVPLADGKRFGVTAAYISANFVNAAKVAEDAGKLFAGVLGYEATANAEVQTIKVSNAREFLEALGSNRIIEMESGKYNLSEWDPYLTGRDDMLKLAEGVVWEKWYNGGYINMNEIRNLTIRGLGASISDTEILVDHAYAYSLSFENCNDIAIENLTTGHSESVYECGCGVLRFADSSRISITETGMYGCGTEGLYLDNVDHMKVTNSRIYECSRWITVVFNGGNIAFENCVFSDNAGGVSVENSKNVSFSDCEFTDNWGVEMFEVEGTTVSVSNCTFSGSDGGKPVQSSNNVEFTGCVFDFDSPEKAKADPNNYIVDDGLLYLVDAEGRKEQVEDFSVQRIWEHNTERGKIYSLALYPQSELFKDWKHGFYFFGGDGKYISMVELDEDESNLLYVYFSPNGKQFVISTLAYCGPYKLYEFDSIKLKKELEFVGALAYWIDPLRFALMTVDRSKGARHGDAERLDGALSVAVYDTAVDLLITVAEATDTEDFKLEGVDRETGELIITKYSVKNKRDWKDEEKIEKREIRVEAPPAG